jgi:hypothetical protein
VCIRDAVETVEVCCEAEEVLMILSRLFQPEKVGPRSICGVQERHFRLSDQRDKKNISGTVKEKTASPSKIKLQKCESIEIS